MDQRLQFVLNRKMLRSVTKLNGPSTLAQNVVVQMTTFTTLRGDDLELRPCLILAELLEDEFLAKVMVDMERNFRTQLTLNLGISEATCLIFLRVIPGPLAVWLKSRGRCKRTTAAVTAIVSVPLDQNLTKTASSKPRSILLVNLHCDGVAKRERS